MSHLKEVKKRKRNDPLSDIETLASLAKQASRRAISRAKAAGVATVYVKDGVLVKRNPDDTIEEIKRLETKPRLTIEDLGCQV